MNKVCSRPFYRSPAGVKEVEQLAEKETKGCDSLIFNILKTEKYLLTLEVIMSSSIRLETDLALTHYQ
jgi:hypothetical protein